MSLEFCEFAGEKFDIIIEEKLHNIAFPNDTSGIEKIKALTTAVRAFLFTAQPLPVFTLRYIFPYLQIICREVYKMCDSRLRYSSITGFFVVSILGSAAHFLYGLFPSDILAAFVPVNESVWEHMKLLFFPFIIYTAVEYFVLGKGYRGFIFSRIVGMLCSLILIPLIFYFYTSFFGRPVLIIDILIFFVCVAVSFIVSNLRICAGLDGSPRRNIAALIIIVCLSLLFFGFTYYPPESEIFTPPTVRSSAS